MYIVEPRNKIEFEPDNLIQINDDKLRDFQDKTRQLVGGLRKRYSDIRRLDISVTDSTSVVTRDEGAPGIRLQILGYSYIEDDYANYVLIEDSHDYMIRRQSAAIDPVKRGSTCLLQEINPFELDSRLTALIIASAMLDL